MYLYNIHCYFYLFSVPELIPNIDVKDAQFDAVIVVTDKIEKLVGNLESLVAPLKKYEQVSYLPNAGVHKTDSQFHSKDI